MFCYKGILRALAPWSPRVAGVYGGGICRQWTPPLCPPSTLVEGCPGRAALASPPDLGAPAASGLPPRISSDPCPGLPPSDSVSPGASGLPPGSWSSSPRASPDLGALLASGLPPGSWSSPRLGPPPLRRTLPSASGPHLGWALPLASGRALGCEGRAQPRTAPLFPELLADFYFGLSPAAVGLYGILALRPSLHRLSLHP